MRKIKAIMLGIILAGLVGCSTDDNNETSSELVSCEYTPQSSWNIKEIFKETRLCSETLLIDFSISDYEKNCEKVEGKFSNKGCPSGSVLECAEEDKDGKKGKMYFYDEKFRNMTCAEFM